jgi:transposase
MTARYELTASQWKKVENLLPGKSTDRGRTGADNRLFVNGCLWIIRSGAMWHHLPERSLRSRSLSFSSATSLTRSPVCNIMCNSA